jgi:hypothetical protein
MPQTSGKATAALVLGICGLVVCPLIGSVIAIVLGYQARSDIDRSGGRIGGRGNATAGLILGWVGVGLCVVGGIIFLMLAAALNNVGDNDYYDSVRSGPVVALAATTLRLFPCI